MTYTNLVKFDGTGYPSCEKHGAMNCVNKERTLYRCPVCHIGIDVSFLFDFITREGKKYLDEMKNIGDGLLEHTG